MKTKSEKSTRKAIGKNITWKIEEDILTLRVDLSEEQGPSKSGKTIIIASSEGNQVVGDVKVGLNVYKYAKSKKGK